MKSLNWQVLLTLFLASYTVSSFRVQHERGAASVSSPAGVPPISEILDNLKNRPGGACVRLLSRDARRTLSGPGYVSLNKVLSSAPRCPMSWVPKLSTLSLRATSGLLPPSGQSKSKPSHRIASSSPLRPRMFPPLSLSSAPLVSTPSSATNASSASRAADTHLRRELRANLAE